MTSNKSEKLSKSDIRVNNLLGLLAKHRVLSISEASEILNVCTMTIRRDCEELEKKKQLSLKNGVIFLSDSEDITPIKKNYELGKETSVQNVAKKAIGKFAASLIEENETIIIDTGSTTEFIVPYVQKNLKFNLFCSNLNILNQAVNNQKINIMFSGGNYHENAQMFESDQSIAFISSFRANKVFISAAGIHDKLGLTCINSYEVPTKQAIISNSDKHILLVDSSKFGKVHSSYFSDLNAIDMIVTDKAISEDWKQKIIDLGIELKIVS